MSHTRTFNFFQCPNDIVKSCYYYILVGNIVKLVGNINCLLVFAIDCIISLAIKRYILQLSSTFPFMAYIMYLIYLHF